MERYSVDGVRYFLLREGVPQHDGNFSEARMVTCLNVELADTLGNLLNRATSVKVNKDMKFPRIPTVTDDWSSNMKEIVHLLSCLNSQVSHDFDSFDFHSGICGIMD